LYLVWRLAASQSLLAGRTGLALVPPAGLT
jgi:hypothetical protein